MFNNLGSAAIGAIGGAMIAGPGGALVGAGKGLITGGAGAEIWQSVSDWWTSTHPARTNAATPSPVIATPPSDTPEAATPSMAYGAACKAPEEDLTGSDARIGSSPPVSMLSVNPDAIMAGWADKAFSRVKNSDGSVTLTAVPTITVPSGKCYVFKYWRVAHSNAPMVPTLAVTTSNLGDVTRAYWEAHDSK